MMCACDRGVGSRSAHYPQCGGYLEYKHRIIGHKSGEGLEQK